MKRRTPCQPCGFALFETLMATAIFTIAGIALISALQTSHLGLADARKEIRAMHKLESFVAEWFESGRALGPGSDQTEPDEEGIRIEWAITPSQLVGGQGDPLSDLLMLQATARWTEGGRDRDLPLERVFNPSLHVRNLNGLNGLNQ